MRLSFAVALAACGPEESDDARVLEPPVVAITAPAEGAMFDQGNEPNTLAGTVHDSFDSPADHVVTWEVDRATRTAGGPGA